MFHPTTRRAALGVVGVGGLGALTACGTDTGQAGAAVSSAASQAASLASSAASQATSAAASAAGDAITKVEIPVGGGKIIDAIKVVITQPTAGDFKAFSAVCTHQGARCRRCRVARSLRLPRKHLRHRHGRRDVGSGDQGASGQNSDRRGGRHHDHLIGRPTAGEPWRRSTPD